MTQPENPFLALRAGRPLRLAPSARFGAAGHLWTKEQTKALILAWAARRPLLVRGEAGSGKSQIARAAAAVLGSGEPLVEVIHPRFDALDLLYQEDTVRRLADAQLGKLSPANDPYIKRGCLWRGFDAMGPDKPTPVLLIDEIDKADADVPNALLDVLGNRSFAVPMLDDRVVSAPGDRLPLTIITTNEERELPAAFVRRCAVLNLNPPEEKDAFRDWLIARAEVHTHLAIKPEPLRLAAEQVWADRQAAAEIGYPTVGLAEYIDLLTALDDLTRHAPDDDREAAQRCWLAKINPYALVKHADQDQRRAPIEELRDTPEPAPR